MKGEAHIGKEWDPDYSSFDSNDEGLVALTFNKSTFNKSLTLAMKKNELLSFELSSCHTSISSLEKQMLIGM
jgi:hypothetical protein